MTVPKIVPRTHPPSRREPGDYGVWIRFAHGPGLLTYEAYSMHADYWDWYEAKVVGLEEAEEKP